MMSIEILVGNYREGLWLPIRGLFSTEIKWYVEKLVEWVNEWMDKTLGRCCATTLLNIIVLMSRGTGKIIYNQAFVNAHHS